MTNRAPNQPRSEHPRPDDQCRSLEDRRPADADTLLDRAAQDLARTFGTALSVRTIREVIDDYTHCSPRLPASTPTRPLLATRFAAP